MKTSNLFQIQQTPDYIEHSFWCVGARFKDGLEGWYKFRDMLFEECGERLFGAWKVPYEEPVIKTGSYKRFLPAEFKNTLTSIGTCPNAEMIQREMMVFKTKYRNDESLNNFLNGLTQTIKKYQK